MSYKRGVHSSVLPAVPADADRVPEPYLLQIVKRPKVRADRRPIARFKLLTPTSQVTLAVMLSPRFVHMLMVPSEVYYTCHMLQHVGPFLCLDPVAVKQAHIGRPSGSLSKLSLVAQAAEGDEATIMSGDKLEQSRWVVPANGSQLLVMQFQSEDMGTFKENLVFEVCPSTLCIHHPDEPRFHQTDTFCVAPSCAMFRTSMPRKPRGLFATYTQPAGYNIWLSRSLEVQLCQKP